MAEASSTEAPVGAPIPRAAIVAEARSWLGTPYRHQASTKGAGCDCFGLIRGVWRAVIGPEPDEVPAYSRDWGSVQGTETLLATARRHLVEVDPAAIAPGDIVVFRIRRGMVAKHVGIVTELRHHTSRSFLSPPPLSTPPASCPGLTRASPGRPPARRQDCRVKPGNDVGGEATTSPMLQPLHFASGPCVGAMEREIGADARPTPGTPPARFVHAQENVPVAEVALSEWWRRRIVAAFAFPGA